MTLSYSRTVGCGVLWNCLFSIFFSKYIVHILLQLTKFVEVCFILLFRCVRFIIRCLGPHFIPLLGQLVTEIVQVYSATHHSCFLYLGSVLVDEFGTDKTCVPGLVQMLEVWRFSKLLAVKRCE